MSSAFTGPSSSTGSPITLMMRPSVPAPTGTRIGAPVSVTAWPRTRPSVVSIAIVRTVDSPRCWATSSTRRLPLLVVSMAFRMAGRCPSNCTSTTAPMTCVMRPVWLTGGAINSLLEVRNLRYDPEKWIPVFGKDHAQLDNRQLDGDVALGRLRIRAHGVSFLGRRLHLVLVGAGDRNLQFGGQIEAALGIQRDLAGHFRGL